MVMDVRDSPAFLKARLQMLESAGRSQQGTITELTSALDAMQTKLRASQSLSSAPAFMIRSMVAFLLCARIFALALVGQLEPCVDCFPGGSLYHSSASSSR
eukprot:m.861185 g.861185  ORF g.861185 m.861185 type:complete len:101 (+) comp59685_c1_seq11:1447-1749(+)